MAQIERRNHLVTGTGAMKGRLLISSIVAIMLFAALGLPNLSEMTGAQVGACGGARLVQYGDGSWGKSIVTPSGMEVGLVKNWDPSNCSSTWYSQFCLTNSNYTFTLHTWHPNQKAYVTYPPVANTWYWTPNYAKGGGEWCNGANVYYIERGKLIGPRWQFLGCFRV